MRLNKITCVNPLTWFLTYYWCSVFALFYKKRSLTNSSKMANESLRTFVSCGFALSMTGSPVIYHISLCIFPGARNHGVGDGDIFC